MKWTGELGHVLAKDLRYARWSLAALIATLALVVIGYLTSNAFGPFVGPDGDSAGATVNVVVELFPLVIVLLSVTTLAMVVQSDRPLQSDSFWTTRPLSAYTLFAAKLLVAIVAIMVPSLIAASVSLGALHTPRHAVPALLAHAALIELGLLLVVVVAAALTSDMKGFVATAVAFILAGLIGFGILLVRADVAIPAAASLGAPVVAIFAIAALYRGRMSGTRQWLIGVIIATLLVMGMTAAPTFGDESRGASHGYEFVGDPKRPDVGRMIHWLTPASRFPPPAMLSAFPPATGRIARFDAGSAGGSGEMTSLRPLVVANLPLKVGAHVEGVARFVAISAISKDSASVSVTVQTVYPARAGVFPLEFAIVNHGRGEAVLLDEQRSSGSAQGWVVLPWISVQSSMSQFSTSHLAVVPRDSAWYTGATLAVVEWEPVR